MGTLLGFPQKEILFFCDFLPRVTDSLTNKMDIPSLRNREDRGAIVPLPASSTKGR
jgi:hypothetical protein